MTEAYRIVRTVRPGVRGGFDVQIKTTDGDVVYDLFTPDPTVKPSESMSSTYYDGILGDPDDGNRATLVVDNSAIEQNRQNQRAVRKLGYGAYIHQDEGELWPADSQE